MANELELPAGGRTLNPVPWDADFGPHANFAAAYAAIPQARRHKGKTVGILQNDGSVNKYWWKKDLTDAGLVVADTTSFIELTTSSDLTFNSALWPDKSLVAFNCDFYHPDFPDVAGTDNPATFKAYWIGTVIVDRGASSGCGRMECTQWDVYTGKIVNKFERVKDDNAELADWGIWTAIATREQVEELIQKATYYCGQFSTTDALNAVTGDDGQYAIVDTGTGNDAKQYIWDSSDRKWVSTSITGISSFSQLQGNPTDNANLATVLSTFVAKAAGKDLSTNDYSTTEKNKLSSIASGATVNSTDSQLRDRSTHTGQQAAASISDFSNAAISANAAVVAARLTGTAATDTETQLNATITEDNKFISRLKLFNWWIWIKTQAQIFTGQLTFNFLPGTDERILSVNATNQVQDTYKVYSRYITDLDIITPIRNASFTSSNNFTASIVPTNGKTMLRGTIFCELGIYYVAIDDNLVGRIKFS